MSAFNLGSVRGFLGLDESNFVRGMLNAEASNEIFGRSVVEFVNNPLLGTVKLLKDAALGTTQLVKDTAFHNQELLRTADRLGTNVELVSALQGAYKGFGQDSGGVERQLTKLNQQIGEAASGNATAQQTFATLGVALRDQHGAARDFTDIFFDVVDALGRTENQSLKVALAQKLFGEDISKVIDVVGRGRGVLDGYIDQARRLGEVFTREQVERADQMASALDNLNRAVAATKAQLAQGLITGFIGEGFDSSDIEKITEAIQSKLVPAAESFGRTLRVIAENLERIEKVGEFVWDRITFAGDQTANATVESSANQLRPYMDRFAYLLDPAAEMQRARGRWLSNEAQIALTAARMAY